VPHAHAPATGALLDTDDDVVAFDSAGGGVAAPAARDEAAEGDDEMTAAEAEEAASSIAVTEATESNMPHMLKATAPPSYPCSFSSSSSPSRVNLRFRPEVVTLPSFAALGGELNAEGDRRGERRLDILLGASSHNPGLTKWNLTMLNIF
jgi:hypothetical protein